MNADFQPQEEIYEIVNFDSHVTIIKQFDDQFNDDIFLFCWFAFDKQIVSR